MHALSNRLVPSPASSDAPPGPPVTSAPPAGRPAAPRSLVAALRSPTRHGGRRSPQRLLAPPLIGLLLVAAIVSGCGDDGTGSEGGGDDQSVADVTERPAPANEVEVVEPPSPAAPDGGLDDPGTPDGEPTGEPVRQPAAPGEPAGAAPGDESSRGAAPEGADSGDGAGVPEGFEDVAPGAEGGADLDLDGPFTDPDDENGAAGAAASRSETTRGADGEEAAEPLSVDNVTVFLVKAADSPPASIRGSAPAGSGERRRPGGQDLGEYAGSFGCGDNLVGLAVPLGEAREVTGAAEHVRLALSTLLDLERDDVPADLMNALRRSPLEVESVEAVADRPGVVRVRLTGPVRLGGTCDAPRVRAQLLATALQIEGVRELEVFVGGEPLDALLSARGTAAR